jgi:hypothetical protein
MIARHDDSQLSDLEILMGRMQSVNSSVECKEYQVINNEMKVYLKTVL